MAEAPLWASSAGDIIAAVKAGRVTPSQLVNVSKARIEDTEAVNSLPPPLRGFEQAAATAAELEKEWALAPGATKPWYYLYGLPVAVKDLTAVAGLPHTMGSLFHKSRVATTDDPVVRAIKRAGAIVVSKSNTPEYGNANQTFNELFGTTYNPWDLRLTPGGSSGGSTAALAAGQVWLALGTDSGGSLRVPSSFCGTVGLRTTVGLVPHAGFPPPVLPASVANLSPPGAGFVHLVTGPLARNVQDLALLLDAMVFGGRDGADSAPAQPPPDSFVAAAQPGALAGVREAVTSIAYSPDLGRGREKLPVDAEVEQITREAARKLAALLGRPLVEDTAPDCSDASSLWRVLRANQLKYLAPTLLSDEGRKVVNAGLIKTLERGAALTEEEVEVAARGHAAYQTRWAAFFAQHPLLITPTVITPPFVAGTQGLDASLPTLPGIEWNLLSTAVSLVAGPAITLPVGVTAAGLPVGLQLVAAPGRDALVVSAAAALESAQPAWAALVPRRVLQATGSVGTAAA